MGRMGAFVSFLGVAGVVACLGYELAIVSATTVREAAHLSLIAVLSVIPASATLTAVLYIAITRRLLGFGILPVYASILLPLAIALTAIYSIFKFWYIREGSFSVISKVQILQSAMRGTSQVLLGWASLGWVGLCLGDIAGRVWGVSGMARLAWPKMRQELSPLNVRRLWQTVRDYRKFPLYALPSQLTDTAAANLPLPLIARAFGAAAAGQFALVQTVLLLSAGLVVSSVADAFHNRLALYARETPERALPLFWKTAAGLAVVGIAPTLLLVFFGPWLFQLVFGKTWVEAGRLVVVVAPWTMAGLVISPLSRVVYVFQAQEMKLIYDLLSMSAVLGVLLVGGRQFGSLRETVKWLSFCQIGAYVVYFFLLLIVLTRGVRNKERPPCAA
jgi:O-antigen/teichoic acid export membrane protein